MATRRQWIQSADVAVDDDGAVAVMPPPATVFRDFAGSGPQTNALIWSPTAGKAIRLTALVLTISADAAVTVFAGTNQANSRLIHHTFKAGSGVAMSFAVPVQLPVNTALRITTNGGDVRVTALGSEV